MKKCVNVQRKQIVHLNKTKQNKKESKEEREVEEEEERETEKTLTQSFMGVVLKMHYFQLFS